MTTDGPPVPAPGDDAQGDDAARTPAPGARRGRRHPRTWRRWRASRTWRRWAGGAVTVLAGGLVLFGLLAPNDSIRLTPAAFLAIPLEALVGVALVLVLPGQMRRFVATVVGVLLGLLTLLKIIDIGFSAVLVRPFDPVLDWTFLAAGVEFVGESFGRAGSVVAIVGAVLVAGGALVLMTLSVLRLTRLVAQHRTAATRTVAVLGVAWLVCSLLGTQVAGHPVAARTAADQALDHALQVPAGLRDREAFRAEAAVDAFRETPGDQMLTALRGKDVLFAFVESYGRSAVADPQYAPQVGAVLDAGTERLRAAGYGSRSAFLTSPTAGGGSWLAHATLLSGLWIDNPQRYHDLIASDRLTLNTAFRRANWRTVGVMPAVTRAWPEGKFYGYDHVYDGRHLGYRGPRFTFASPPDQFTLAAFQRFERAAPGHAPVFGETALLSSHTPWAPIPRLIDWNEVGDGSVYRPIAKEGDPAEVIWRDADRVRTEYRRSIEYSVSSLISYVQTYGDDNLVLVFLGDHQPAPIITGDGASRDVPITIVAKDHAVLDRIASWGWQDGLNPGPQAPVWRMNSFRDRFLTAFGSQPRPSSAAPPPGR